MKLSVIIATHARAAGLNRLLSSLAPRIIPGGVEILVADNGTSAPSLIEHPQAIAAHLHQKESGKCRVQNRAIEIAKGEIIACLDDDLRVAPGYFGAVVNFFADHPGFSAMKGRILAERVPEEAAGDLAPYLDLPIVDHGDRVMEVSGVLGANMAFRRIVFDQVGMFDERLGPGACGHEEETEFSARMRRAGFKIGYAPQALVYHDVDSARADRARFLRVAFERGQCRMLHENHSRARLVVDASIAAIRLAVCRAFGAPLVRIAREEKRQATVRGMLAGGRAAHSGRSG